MVILLTKKISPEEFEQAREVYSDYIKIVVDIELDIMAVGGEYHIDCEEVLLAGGSKQENLYGGGMRVSTGEIEFMAMSNYKPHLGRTSYEVMDENIRKKIAAITKKLLLL